MNGTTMRSWVLGIAVVCLLLLVAFGLGLYAGSNGWTTPTVPPWPEPAQRVAP
ncbi:MAG: hypothetical protein M3437_08220 [Chloroflexota bacterium]|nr:hypothetical protein [Chloroflexota bacterium]MDQ5865959.1 hypothetical protein [Chloroflexota bacterium]